MPGEATMLLSVLGGFDKIAPFLSEPLVLIGFVVALCLGLLKLLLRLLVEHGIIPGLSKASAASILRLIINYGFLLAVLVFLLGFMLRWREDGGSKATITAREEVKEIATRIVGLRGTYESIIDLPNTSDPAVEKVREDAPKAAAQLLNFSDTNLDAGNKILKYAFGGAAYVLGGQVESVPSIQNDHARRAISALDRAASLISAARKAANGSDAYYIRLVQWIDNESLSDWILYNKAIAKATRAKSGEAVTWNAVAVPLRSVSRVYLSRYALRRNPELSWACSHLSGSDSFDLC